MCVCVCVYFAGDDVHTESELILDAENRKMCILFNTSDNSYVEGGRSYTVRVNTSDEAVNLPLFEATVNVYDDDGTLLYILQ